MAVFKCKMCGGMLEFAAGDTVAVCDSCGCRQTLPRLDDERRANLYDRANHFRRNGEFDRARGIYEQILNEDGVDAEAYWSIVLCRFGVEYVEDPATHRRVATINRTQYTSVFDDENYRSAFRYADDAQREIYREEAEGINEIQKEIMAIAEREKPFDVFICYKETDDGGSRTQDSVLANDLYHELTEEGFRVFFSRITLEDKLGAAYEPYIFAALNSAKVMVVIGTRPEYFQAVWVKNEWSRYLALMKGGAKKVLIPAYRDMDPYDLPEEFSHLQAQDMAKLGFMQDLIRGIKKIAADEAAETVEARTAVVGARYAAVEPLLKRAFLFLEDGRWRDADEYCEKVLDQNPECARAYLGKLMAELHIKKQEALADCEEPFAHLDNYCKVMRFADEGLKSLLTEYTGVVDARCEKNRVEAIYTDAVRKMGEAKDEHSCEEAARLFEQIADYRDAAELRESCFIQAKNCSMDRIYIEPKMKMDGGRPTDYEEAVRCLQIIPGWRDADELVNLCQMKREEALKQEEAVRVASLRQARRRKRALIGMILGTAAGMMLILAFVFIIRPEMNYRIAHAAMEEKNYAAAYSTFSGMSDYKDSAALATESRYQMALLALEEEDYETAYDAFTSIELMDYKDSAAMQTETRYRSALKELAQGNYTNAGFAFGDLEDYKDSAAMQTECWYQLALEDLEQGNIDVAYRSLAQLGDYKDSVAAVRESRYQTALGAIEAGKYSTAYRYLRGIEDYKDSGAKCEALEQEAFEHILRDVRVGEEIYFGAYEQDNNTGNGKEAIAWTVLAR